MKAISTLPVRRRTATLALLLAGSAIAVADDQATSSAAIDGVKGVKQEAVQSIKNVAPPTAIPPAAIPPTAVPQNATSAAQGINKVDGINTINGVKAPGQQAPQPIPPPPKPVGSATHVGDGSVGAVSSIRAVKGVQGINAPKQQNLEAALQIKDAAGPPNPKGKAAAAALFKGNGPAGKPVPGADGRADFQEFEKLNTPGS